MSIGSNGSLGSLDYVQPAEPVPPDVQSVNRPTASSTGSGIQRRSLRLALGAQRRDVLWMFMRETLLVVATGAAIGLPAAIAAAYALRSLLFGLEPSDPATIIGAIVTLAGAGALAGFLPARRAASLLPMDALRHE